MNRPIYFCKSWFRARKQPTEVWTVEQARAAHEEKRLYTVLVDSAERPHCFLEVTARAVGVGFLDSRLRECLSYGFQEVEPGQIFLSMATWRDFVGETDKVASGTTYIFKRDGTVSIHRERFVPNHASEIKTTTTDVAPNYSAMPAFGEYDDLIRAERVSSTGATK